MDNLVFKRMIDNLMKEYKEFKAAIITLRKYIINNKIKFETKEKFKELIIMWQKIKKKDPNIFLYERITPSYNWRHC